MIVKVSRLTGLNVRALEETMSKYIEAGELELGKTVATFRMADPLAALGEAQTEAGAKHGTRGHPYQSLHAVERKLWKAISIRGDG